MTLLAGHLTFFQQYLYVGLDGFGLVRRGITMNGFTLTIDEEFREIPFDGFGSEDTRFCGLQIVIDWMSVRSIHIDLGKKWKRHAVLQVAERLNFRFGSGFLASELIAGKPED